VTVVLTVHVLHVTETPANAVYKQVKIATRKIFLAKSNAATAVIIANVLHATEIHANANQITTAVLINLLAYAEPPNAVTAAEKIASVMNLAKINAFAKQIKSPATKKLFARV